MNMKPPAQLLTRDEFREGVFARDGWKCVICKAPAKDAHHILERRLFPDGGYYLDNGASLCERHHIEAEQTTLTCEQVREAAGITRIILPPHLYQDQPYDKWGNPILPNGLRLRGELFQDQSVQKILEQGGALASFTNRVKYPRTYHLPWSPGITDDDRIMDNTDRFTGEEVVVCVKLDGENTTMYRDYIHARSLEHNPHPSRNWVKALHGRIAYDIPEGWRLSVENLYARHSIHYKNLEDYAVLFAVWDEQNYCLPWDEVVEWGKLLDLTVCPIIYRGTWNEELIRNLHRDTYNGDECEGYVVRLAEKFHYKDFRNCVGKYVRKNHVRTHGHWMRQAMIPNEVKKDALGTTSKPEGR